MYAYGVRCEVRRECHAVGFAPVSPCSVASHGVLYMNDRSLGCGDKQKTSYDTSNTSVALWVRKRGEDGVSSKTGSLTHSSSRCAFMTAGWAGTSNTSAKSQGKRIQKRGLH